MRINPLSIRLLLILGSVVTISTGCVTAAKPTESEAGAATAAAPAPAPAISLAPEVTEAPAKPDDWCSKYPESFVCQEAQTTEPDTSSGQLESSLTSYEVKAGDHLWGISSLTEVYNDPYHWPLLFKRNRFDISDADLIYPGQVIHIERDLSDQQIQQAVSHAKTRGAWTLGFIEESDIKYLVSASELDSTDASPESASIMIARASSDLNAAKAKKGVWRLIDSATGGSAVSITKLLKTAKDKLEAGDAHEAYRIALRVSEAAQLGVAQAEQQFDASPRYN